MANATEKAIERMIKLNLKELRDSTDVKGCQFAGVRNYTNKHEETSNYVILLGTNHDKINADNLARIRALKDNPELCAVLVKEVGLELATKAIDERIKSLESCADGTNKYSVAQEDAFIVIRPGLKVHSVTGQFYVYGQRISKTVLVKGTYPVRKKRPLTLAKERVDELAGVKDDFCQFNLDPEKIGAVNIAGKNVDFELK